MWTSVNVVGDLDAAIRYFQEKLPGWWFSVGACHVSADATVGPDCAGVDAYLLMDRDFDEGFSVDLLPPATMADALRQAADLALIRRQAAREAIKAAQPK